MSFVYAQKIGQSIAVFADTKITFSMPDATILFSTETQKNVRQFGMIKNIIISKNYCICFAGNNIIYANELLKKIDHITLPQLLDLALEINCRDSDNGAEFLICYANGSTQLIFQVKDKQCNEVPSAWIGSYTAFRYFQGVRNGVYKGNVESNFRLSYETYFCTSPFITEDDEYQKLFNSFHKTVFDSGDDSVGGFVVPVLFDPKSNQFWYKGYCRSYARMKETSKGLSMPMYQGPSSGGYSVLFYQSPSCVGIYIPENSWGIIYNHYRANPKDYEISQSSSFLTPQTTKMSQLDFYVQTGAHGMSPPGFFGVDPDRIDDYLERVWFYKDEPELALLYINKAIEIIEKQHRDEWRYEELMSIKRNIKA